MASARGQDAGATSIKFRSVLSSDMHFELSQFPPQLLHVLHLDGMHSHLPRTLEVQRAIVNEAAIPGRFLSNLERHAVNAFLRLA
jgi:hypothetical protein